jgi:hypothetical protein
MRRWTMTTMETIAMLAANINDDAAFARVVRALMVAPAKAAPVAAAAVSSGNARAPVRRGTGHTVSPAETYCHTLLMPWLRAHPTVDRMTAAEMLAAVPWPESLSVVTTPGRSLGGFLGALHARKEASSCGLYVESTSVDEGRPGDRRAVAYALRIVDG